MSFWHNIQECVGCDKATLIARLEDVNICKTMEITEVLLILKEKMTGTEKDLIRDIISIFMGIAKDIELTYMLTFGSLLGSYRHHGFIPWDDDFDILVNVSHMSTLESGLKNGTGLEIAKRYHDYTGEFVYMWKVFIAGNGTRVGATRSFTYPYMDLYFYTENSTHIWSLFAQDPIVLKKKDVFPLALGWFENRMMPVPRYTRYVLETMYRYNISMCETGGNLDHKTDTLRPTRCSVSCKDIAEYYPMYL